jgi:hypothetical protein
MLIIEIALGIVLGWLIINHFDAVIDAIFNIVSGFFRIILFPFKLAFKIFKEVALVAKELLFGLTYTATKILKWLIPIAIVVGIAYGSFYLLFEFIPQPYSRYIFFLIFGGGLLYGSSVMMKESYENYKNKTSKHWLFGAFASITISLFLLLMAINGVTSIFH